MSSAADAMVTYAINNLCTLPVTGGDTFAGWPIDKLAEAALPFASQLQRGAAIAALKSKYAPVQRNMPPPALATPSTILPIEMLAMRMRWPMPSHAPKWHGGFAHIAVHAAGDKVHTWIITTDGQATTIEEDATRYPSDALITKLNMLKRE